MSDRDIDESGSREGRRGTLVLILLLGMGIGFVFGVIVGIVFGASVASIPNVRSQARKTACANNLKQIGLASQMYLNELRVFPFSAKSVGAPSKANPGTGATGSRHIQLLFDEVFLDDPEVAICPASTDVPATRNAAGGYTLGVGTCSYLWNLQPLTWSSPADIPLATCKAEKDGPGNDCHHGGRNVLLLQGNVKWISSAEFERNYKKYFYPAK